MSRALESSASSASFKRKSQSSLEEVSKNERFDTIDIHIKKTTEPIADN